MSIAAVGSGGGHQNAEQLGRAHDLPRPAGDETDGVQAGGGQQQQRPDTRQPQAERPGQSAGRRAYRVAQETPGEAFQHEIEYEPLEVAEQNEDFEDQESHGLTVGGFPGAG